MPVTFGFILSGIAAIFAAIGFVFWVWMLFHAITNNGLGKTEKIVWVLVVFFLNLLGALIYFFLGRTKATS
jgi:uncharacterized membrane protein